MPFAIGQTIGPYRIIEQLGQGGMATVYKAYHASLDRYVAIKVLHQAFLEDSNFLARFQREARLVARLEHPNIVPIYDYAQTDGQPYLVMKYIEGETLKAHLNRGTLEPAQIRKIVEQVGAGLSYAHSQGILHRDIKPSNVILSNDGGIYLADFGLARIAQSSDLTLTSDMILGTPQYISPEQALGKSDLDQGTDIYSFGVMLYEMTTGRVPFSADTPFSVIHDHIYSPLPLPTQVNPSLSMEVERSLLKALAKERADRYTEVSTFVADFLSAWQAMDSVAATEQKRQMLPAEAPPVAQFDAEIQVELQDVDSSSSQSESPKRRHPGWLKWALAGLLVFLCMCCLLVSALNGRDARENRNQQENIGEVIIPDLEEGQEMDEDEVEVVNLDIRPLEQAVQMVESDPESPVAHVELGLSLIKSGQDFEGHLEIRAASELARSDGPLLIGLARALEERKIWNGALIMYLRAYESRPRLPLLLDKIRKAAYYAVENPLAPEIIDVAILERVDNLTSLMAQARYAVLHHQDFERANHILDEMRAIEPGLPEASLIESEMALFQGDIPRAKTVLDDLLRRNDVLPWVRQQAEHFLQKTD